MTASPTRSALARKIAAHNGAGMQAADLLPQLETGLTRALRRAAAPLPGFNISVADVEITLAINLETAIGTLPETGLVAATEDGEGRRGLLALEHGLVDALIEVQTTGRVEQAQGPARAVTRIDEALCRDFIDLMFGAFAHEAKDIAGRDWPNRMSYGSRIGDRSQINLLLPAHGYHLLQATVTAGGLKSGKLAVLLPTDASLARQSATRAAAKPPRPETWADDMLAALGAAPLALDAVLLRMEMPLSAVEALIEGDLIRFDRADLGAVTLESGGGHVMARGKLGQVGGRRAVRLGVQDADRTSPEPSNLPGKTAPKPPGALRDAPVSPPPDAGDMAADVSTTASTPPMTPDAHANPNVVGFDPETPVA